jgi:archaellum component FlaG (FlaF/FlaG flagellin family)/uncharacterized protein YjeT (DUF2065 family)
MRVRVAAFVALILTLVLVLGGIAQGAAPAAAPERIAELDEIIGDLERLLATAWKQGTAHADIIDGLEASIGKLRAHRALVASELEVVPAIIAAMPDPGNLRTYRARTGETLYFMVRGSATNQVWGTGTYTDDSYLAAAAVHAGALRAGEWGVVAVTMLPGQSRYLGSMANSVTSGSYGAYDGSYQVSRASAQAVYVLPDPGSLTHLRTAVGQTFYFKVTGSATGSLWGTQVYTDDSAPSKAAVHAGFLKPGEEGIISVMIMPGQKSYPGSTQNGVSSASYWEYGGSYKVVGRLQ